MTGAAAHSSSETSNTAPRTLCPGASALMIPMRLPVRGWLGAVAVLSLGATAASHHASRAARAPAADSLRVPILVYHSVMPHHPGQTAEQRVLNVDDSVFVAQM